MGTIAKATFLTGCFAAAGACFGFAAKLRFVDHVRFGEDIVFWVVGIVVNFFAGIAVGRMKTSMREWLVAHAAILRLWTACSALGNLSFGGGLAAVSILGWFARDRAHRGLGSIALIFALVGLGLVGWGVVQAASLRGSARQLVDVDPPL